MLLNIHVKNLALIRETEVEFGPGLNILTGETGAGKSILLGSMQMALGGKVSKEMLRPDAPYGLVELLFSVEDSRTEDILKDMEIYTEEGQVLLSRKVMEGRSVCRINGETCTIARMKKAASYLLDIHGQHEHQSLLNRQKQLDILDEFGKEEILEKKGLVSSLYYAYTDIKRQLSAQDMDEEQRKRELSFLEFEIQEIEDAGLTPMEDVQLEQEYQKLNNSKKIIEYLRQTHQFTGYDSDLAAGELVGRALHSINSVSSYDEEIAAMEQMLGDIDALLNDFNRELSAYMDGLTFEEQDFYQLEQRLDTVNNLKSKYGKDIPAIMEYQKRQQEKLAFLQAYEANRNELKKQQEAIRKELDEAVSKLSQVRKAYARQLENLIIEELKELNFLDVKFEICFEEARNYSAKGRDDIEYRISTNPGESVKALESVVSGGELSRIMLAIKTLLADKDQVDTLIFDEIDTGISGRTAQKVSEKMDRIGARRQVICITHLPQIASMADIHYAITKEIKDNQTITKIQQLTKTDSVKELARLLGGAEITDKVLESAREMKVLAQQQKNARLHS